MNKEIITTFLSRKTGFLKEDGEWFYRSVSHEDFVNIKLLILGIDSFYSAITYKHTDDEEKLERVKMNVEDLIKALTYSNLPKTVQGEIMFVIKNEVESIKVDLKNKINIKNKLMKMVGF